MGLGLVCSNDVASSKRSTSGRGVTDDSQTSMGTVMCCGCRKCMTCSHLVYKGDTFTSNVTNKTYGMICPGTNLGCSTRSVIYLISCRKCGIQYVGGPSTITGLDCIHGHRVDIATVRNGWLLSAPTHTPIVCRGYKLASWTLGALLNILSTVR